MLFRPSDIPGLFLTKLEGMEDERDFFSSLFYADAFLQQELPAACPQGRLSTRGDLPNVWPSATQYVTSGRDQTSPRLREQ
jgi:dTDP-4-dehydrorhamnose 3,5-epimerase-like enzyme